MPFFDGKSGDQAHEVQYYFQHAVSLWCNWKELTEDVHEMVGWRYPMEANSMKSTEFRDESGNLCHLVFRPSLQSGRKDLTPNEALLQVASICPEDNSSFRAHRHIPKRVGQSQTATMESWVVLAGEVTALYFDELDKQIGSMRLSSGDVTLTFSGGHAYKHSNGLIAVEFKSGPYLGQSQDKVFIDT